MASLGCVQNGANRTANPLRSKSKIGTPLLIKEPDTYAHEYEFHTARIKHSTCHHAYAVYYVLYLYCKLVMRFVHLSCMYIHCRPRFRLYYGGSSGSTAPSILGIKGWVETRV